MAGWAPAEKVAAEAVGDFWVTGPGGGGFRPDGVGLGMAAA